MSFLHDLLDLEGKSAVVIGGGGHLCSAMAEGLALSGCNVAIVDLRLEKAVAIGQAINPQKDRKIICLRPTLQSPRI